tara:strand:+ start:82 stop:732 length:651 start_codon:yes stop_codon:yes gene_type:complete
MPDMNNIHDCSCSGGIVYNHVQCRSCGCTYTCDASGCGPSTCSPANLVDITQKRIWNTVRVQASEYTMNLASLSTYQKPNSTYDNVNWNQMSDRALPSNSQVESIKTVPSRGNSTKSSLTRDRPGSQAPGGKGVDIKHGSYARYLARLKGKGPLRTQPDTGLTPVNGNKTKSYGIVRSRNCMCFTNGNNIINNTVNLASNNKTMNLVSNNPSIYYH